MEAGLSVLFLLWHSTERRLFGGLFVCFFQAAFELSKSILFLYFIHVLNIP